jgi:hypothetical protein
MGIRFHGISCEIGAFPTAIAVAEKEAIAKIPVPDVTGIYST